MAETAHQEPGQEGFAYRLSDQPAPAEHSNEKEITWQASEYLHHEKGAGWFLGISLAGAALALGLFLIVDLFSAIVVVLMVVALIVYGNRAPRTLQYSIDEDGIVAGDKEYSFADFRSFSIMQEGAITSVVLQPMRRFMPPLTLYFSPDHGDAIISALVEVLPHEEQDPDFIDRLVRRIRF